MGSRGLLASYLLYVSSGESTFVLFTSLCRRVMPATSMERFAKTALRSIMTRSIYRSTNIKELDVIKGKLSPRWNSVGRASIRLMVFASVSILGVALTACSSSAPASPTAAAVATKAVATAGAVAPAVSTAASAVAPVANAAAATAEAIGTKAAPTISAAATALAPTAAAAATAAVSAAGTATATTAGQLADAGQSVFATSCAVCHGAQGEGKIGPALWGPNANFGTFKSAQDLLTFIGVTMPLTHPGALTPEQAMDVTAYLLVQDGFVQRNASLSNAGFGSIQLKK